MWGQNETISKNEKTTKNKNDVGIFERCERIE
jgi:hypothetical protein